MADNDAITVVQNRLRGDHDRLLEYGRGCPAEWGGVWFEEMVLVVGFTRPDEHRAAVSALLEHPQEVRVVGVDRPLRDLAQVRQAVERVLREHPQSWVHLSTHRRHVHVQLRARGLALAEQLWAEHGDALVLSVPGYSHPGRPDAEALTTVRPGPQATASWPEGLVAELELDAPTTRSGEVVRGALVLRATTRAVRFDTGQPLVGELLDVDGHVMNDLTGPRMGTGLSVDLSPGEAVRVALTVGTDSASARYGALVPAGTHDLVVPLQVQWAGAELRGRAQLVAGPFPVHLIGPTG